MAQNTVVKEPLTEAMVRAGAQLTRKLDELRWPVLASLWLYQSESNQWKLIIASPAVTTDGPKKSYEKIQAALANTPDAAGALTLSDIGVTDPKDPLILLLRAAIKTEPTVSGIRFTRNVINGRFIEDAYIYRMSDITPPSEKAS